MGLSKNSKIFDGCEKNERILKKICSPDFYESPHAKKWRVTKIIRAVRRPKDTTKTACYSFCSSVFSN
jgi:hypothetical protein